MVTPIPVAGSFASELLTFQEPEPVPSDVERLLTEETSGSAEAGPLRGREEYLPSGSQVALLHVQVQLSLEQTVYTRGGQVLGSTSLLLNYERTELLFARYAGAPDGAGAGGPGGGIDPLQTLRDHFTPENTSQRIVRFATDGFREGRFSGGTGLDARAAFRDFILPFIEQAVDEVLGAFGNALPDSVGREVRKTLDLVREGLRRFAAGDAAAPAASPEASAGPSDDTAPAEAA